MSIRGEEITNEFWEYVENRKDKYKIAKKVYNWLDKDNLGAIRVDYVSKKYWIEFVCEFSTLPAYAYHYIEKFAKIHGFEYLFNE